ncbi:TKL protein kinase [Phytophthora palmivora]|uniref:TKL protein kinase n=1 Tax=Phytophthora palmivora TaxID=4796 RepID=A0A2P4XAE7_9STRA|nr:TKL protein kinase [Phytophthora palmivora]
MGEEVVVAAASNGQSDSSTAKSRDAAKKRAALWKKQAKSFKLKDVDKKVDAVRFCAQDEQFFREQPEVLRLLMGFLTRTKTPELVMETLTVLHTLLSPPMPTGNGSDAQDIHPEINASFMLERSMNGDSTWKAGEPFINLFSLNSVTPEIRIKAIEVFDLLLRACVVLSASAGEATQMLLQFQSVGSPCSALLGCLAVDNNELQFAALSGLRSLMGNPPNEEFLCKFETEKGISRSLEFVCHAERRFHRPALGILESFSHFECGRELLRKNGAANVLRNMIQEAHQTIMKTSTIVPVSGMDASPLSIKDAPLLCSNMEVIGQVFVRTTLANEQVATSQPVEDNPTMFMEVIDAMVYILRYDITSALTPAPVPSETPRATGGAAAVAAANAAAANAAALAALIPFNIDRSVAIITSLGRIIEYSEKCKAHAKAQGILPVLLDCFKVKNADNLHQVADKLLHLFCDVLAHETENDGIASVEEKSSLVDVEALLSLVRMNHETSNKPLIFRHLRWIAALVDLPESANALGERAVSLFLQILVTTSSGDNLLFAFLAKCIHAIVLQNSSALEVMDDLYKLEWIDEYEEQAAYHPKPLTKAVHSIDVFLSVGEALTGLTNAFLKWNPNTTTSIACDFSELLAAKQGSDYTSPGKSGVLPQPAGSKKKLPADQSKPSSLGEAVMLCILEKGMLVPTLVSNYAAVNPAVCVSLLELLRNLMTVPSGMKVLLHLAKTELESATPSDHTEPTAITADMEWPLSVELSSRMEHTLLLLPVLNVLQSPGTSFSEIEAAIRSIAVMTSDLEFTNKETLTSAPEPIVETAKSPTKGGPSAAVAQPAPPAIPELVIHESDRCINAALGCGALVVLLSFMDRARIPRDADNFVNRVNSMIDQIEELVHKFITLAKVKQENILTTYREKLELEQPPTTESGLPTEVSVNVDLLYQARWAQMLLDHTVSIPRFGYISYSALLLASELALPKVVSTLLNAGASTETASPEGLTPLMIAFLVGNEEMVIDLLDAHANIDAITKDGQDLTVWNCALVSPVKAQVSTLIMNAYDSANSSENVSILNASIELDSIEGSLQFLDMCLDACVDANVSNAQGDFLLHALLSKSIVRRKLRGLDLCFRYHSYNEDQRRLHNAVVYLIEEHSANVNNCNRMGQTPLHLALLHGYTDIVKILLNHGTNPNIQGIYGHLPLHYACLGFCGNLDGSDGEAVEITRLLLEHARRHPFMLGSHIDRRKHKTAAEKQALAIENILESGLQSVIEPQSIVSKLASAQQILTKIQILTKTSFTGKFLPWHFACGAYVQLSSVLCLDDDMQKWFEANGQARADILRFLIREWNIDISATASDSVTALHLAVKSDVNGNNLPIIDLLLENCCARDRAATLNVNAVHDHILIDSLPVIPSGAQAVFIDDHDDRKQAYVSSRSIDGKYHIILADGCHVVDVSREHLQVIYDPSDNRSHHSHHFKYVLPMESRFAALHYALQSNHDTLPLRLLAVPSISLDPEGSDLPLLALACAARQTPEVVKRLITQQANMRVHLPLRTSKCDLSAIDADTTSSIAKRKQAAALHYAVMYDDFAMVEVLLSNPSGHVQPNVKRSGDGFTPLHLACEVVNMKIIKLLLDHGANLTQLSSMSAHGISPLELLMKFDNLENEKLKELVSENYLRPEMLMEGGPGDFTSSKAIVNPTPQEELNPESEKVTECLNNDGDNNDAPTCVFLLEEERNLNLFERLQKLNCDKRANYEGLQRRLETDLEKSDAVLRVFFNLLEQPSASESQLENTPVTETFQLLRHPHECYRRYTTRSQWKPKKKMPRIESKITLAEAVTEPTTI